MNKLLVLSFLLLLFSCSENNISIEDTKKEDTKEDKLDQIANDLIKYYRKDAPLWGLDTAYSHLEKKDTLYVEYYNKYGATINFTEEDVYYNFRDEIVYYDFYPFLKENNITMTKIFKDTNGDMLFKVSVTP